jgi:PAS domain-containing protein
VLHTDVTRNAVGVAEPDPAFEPLLAHVRDNRGFDFTGYKRSSLARRVDRRMTQVRVDDYSEELETTNEEVQSTNDELLTGMRAGVVVLAPDLSVRVWNQEAQDLWGLRPEETIGQHFLTLDIGQPLEQLAPMMEQDDRADGDEGRPGETGAD